jgi:hypothetical protein
VAQISIDRMSVTVSSISSADSERLARLIAERLAAASSKLETSGRWESVRVQKTEADGQGVDRLAQQFVDDIIRQLRRE